MTNRKAIHPVPRTGAYPRRLLRRPGIEGHFGVEFGAGFSTVSDEGGGDRDLVNLNRKMNHG